MKKSSGFCLILALIGMIWNDASWANRSDKSSRGYSGHTPSRSVAPGRSVGRQNPAYRNANRPRSFSGGRSVGRQNPAYRNVQHTRSFSGRSVGRHNLAFGGAYRTSSFGYGGIYSHRSPRTRFYGSFSYGQPFPYYRSFNRPFYHPYYSPFYDPFFWPAYPPIYPPVVVVPDTPPVYIQQPRVVQSAPPAAVISTTNYWYYCENPAGYYPEVKSCSGDWIQVPPRPTQ
jgi:hypothetical protein